MKKKGMTLVELLVVIGILSALILLALPNAVKALKNSRRNIFLTDVKTIYSTAVSQAQVDHPRRVKDLTYCRFESKECDFDDNAYETLELGGKSETDYYLVINRENRVVYFTATDGEFQYVLQGEELEDVSQITIEKIEDVSEIEDTEQIVNIQTSAEESIRAKQLCVVAEKSYTGDKAYYNFDQGSTAGAWKSSVNNKIGISLQGFVDVNDNYSDITDSTQLMDSNNGCYYPKMMEVCIVPYLSINFYSTKITVPEGITKDGYNNGIFKTTDIPFDQFILKTGLFHSNPGSLTKVMSKSEGCYYSGTRSSLGNKVTVYAGKSNPKQCYEYQTVGECLEDSSIGGRTVYYGRKWLQGGNYGQLYTINPMEKVDPNETYTTSPGFICLDGESEIEVYDKKKKKKIKKKLKDITYDDLILCWDFDLGKFTYQKPVWIKKHQNVDESLVLTFSDGSILKVAGGEGDHRIYNLDAQAFTSCKSEKATPIGMRTINSKNEIITLVSREKVKENITICNVVTYKDINIYANGILTSRGSNNLYEIKDMKFVKGDRETLSREDLPEVSNDMFYGLRLGERDVALYGSKEDAIKELTKFAKELEDTKK